VLYKTRANGKVPTLEDHIRKLKYYHFIEKTIAERNDKIALFIFKNGKNYPLS
jgi:hypothetical protein